MNKFAEFKKISYFYAFLIALAFAVAIFISANIVDVSSSFVPFLFLTAFDIGNVLIVKKYQPRYCFGPFALSSFAVYVFYKIVSVLSFLRMCSSDGFLTDGEFAHAYALDILMVSLVISSFIFNVFMRFIASRQKFKNISRESVKRFVICIVIFVVLGCGSIFSWKFAEPLRDEYIEYVSTFSTDKWTTFPESRIRMYDDLTKEHQLSGKNVADIESLLGSPDVVEGDTLIYKLGDNEKGHNRLYIYLENENSESFEIKTEEFLKLNN